MHAIKKLSHILTITKRMLRIPLAYCSSDQYSKTSFDWQPSKSYQNKKHNSNQRNYPNSSQRNNHDKSQGMFKNKTNVQQSVPVQEKDAQAIQNSKLLNPNLSLVSQISSLKSVKEICMFYEAYKQLYTPRILAISARLFASVLEKQKNTENYNSLQSTRTAHKFIASVLSNQLPKLGTQQMQHTQLKDMLFFIKKILHDLSFLIHLEAESQYYDSNLHRKVLGFRDRLLMIFLDKSFNYAPYEIHELVEIIQLLIKFSHVFEVEQIYQCIAQREKLIEETVNHQFLFSATNFMTTVKQIEFKSQLPERKNEQHHLESFEESLIAQTYRSAQTPEEIKRLLELREKCYEIFMNRWAYYIGDMNKFVRVGDVMKIWPGIALSSTGCKLLLRGDTGPALLKSISQILEINSSTVSELIGSHPRVLTNSTVIFYLLSKKNPDNKLLKELLKEAVNQVKRVQMSEKNWAKIRMKKFVEFLNKMEIVSVTEAGDIVGKINGL